MNTSTVLLIAVPILVLLAGFLIFASARRRDSRTATTGVLSSETKARDRGPLRPGAAEGDDAPVTGREVELSAREEYRGSPVKREPPPPPVAWVPPDDEVVAVSRRQFFNRSTVAAMGLGLSGFGAAVVAFLWPGAVGGFGAQIRVGRFGEIDERIEEGGGFAYYPEGRMWVTRYPRAAVDAAQAVYTPGELNGMEAGYVALFQTCPHLGCRVPECASSQWFECPCHGSQYNRVGEHKAGPAPRGMDRFPTSVDGDVLVVDTGEIINGPPLGTNTTGQEAEGPHCV